MWGVPKKEGKRQMVSHLGKKVTGYSRASMGMHEWHQEWSPFAHEWQEGREVASDPDQLSTQTCQRKTQGSICKTMTVTKSDKIITKTKKAHAIAFATACTKKIHTNTHAKGRRANATAADITFRM